MHFARNRILTQAIGFFVSAILSLLLCVRGHAATLPTGFTETDIGGTWNEAVGLTFASDGRMYVWERIGRVWIVENGVKSATPFLDISDEVAGYRDFGLLGFALHPDFYNNGYVYLLYTVDRHHLFYAGTGNYNASSNLYYQATIGRITRYTANSTNGFRSVNPTSRKILLGDSRTNGFPMLYESHGVGTILFGTDGTLLASCGDGASYSSQDTGSAAETYYQQALTDGIIRPKENVGAYRAQLVDCLNGKIIRIDPDTGDGIPSNPFYNAAAPKSARSRVWALGVRNPYRMTLRQETSSHIQADGKPGVLYIGDVGNGTWEDLNICDRPGQNFGWPVFEGLTSQAGYSTANTTNQDAPNPLYGVSGCTQQYFYFRDLINQDSALAPSWPNPCNSSQQIPTNLFRFVHSRPALDWRHGQLLARTGIYSNNQAAVINVGAAGSPVTGTNFAGNSVTAGSWYTNTAFPALYRNTFFAGDYGGQWIRNFSFTTNDKPTAVRPFTDNAGGVVDIKVDPFTGDLYYITWTANLRRVRYTPSGNQPPIAVASANTNYGPAPLTVQLSSTGSSDPENQPLRYSWNFGDGTPNSTNANPSHTFNTTNSAPTSFTVTLVVTDNTNASATNRLLISANNTPPQVTITSPVNGTLYTLSNATTYNCTAIVTDAEHGPNQRTCVWQTILHHNNHFHSEPPDTNCTTTALISPIGCNGETYYYRIVLTVTDAGGLATTKEVLLYPNCFPKPPVITNAPQSQTVLISNSAAFSVIAGGDSPLIYRWRKNGTDLANQTNTTLLLSNVQLPDAANYTVVVSNAYGVVTSAPPAVLTVIAPPSISLTNPANGAAFPWSSNILIAASASAIGTNVSLVEFYADGSKLGQNSSSPYTLTWSNALAGVHQLSARATDARGTMATSTVVTITVSNVPPFADINTPANGVAFPWSSNIIIAATASATGTNIALVEFFANGNLIGQDSTNPYGLTWSNAVAGVHQLTVKATDARGIAATSAVVTITVTNVPPVVSISAPTNAAAFPWSSNISIAASAFAHGTNVALVEFFADGSQLGQASTNPYGFIWSNAIAGVHQLTARATDARGIVATSAVVAITVTNVPPAVSISSPSNGVAFPWSSNIVIAATASATGTNVALIEFFANGSKLGEDSVSPFTFTWSNAAAGAHQLTTKATDARGVVATSAVVAITVTNVSPTVSIIAPTNGFSFPWSSNIVITASASASGTNVALVEFFANGTKLGEDGATPFNFAWSDAAAGVHQLSARATDARGIIATSTVVTITVTNVPPVVNISTPTNGTAFPWSSNILIAASASATGTNITLVEFYANGSKLGEDSVSPFGFSWSNAAAGVHQLTARVTDARNLIATSAVVTITVSNVPPVVTLDAPTNGAAFPWSSNILITATASANGTNAALVEFFADGSKLGEDSTSPFSIIWNNAPAAVHQLSAKVTDARGLTATSIVISVTVTNVLPQVAISAPTNGAVCPIGSNILIAASASANGTNVALVEFFANGSKLGEDGTSPFNFAWSNSFAGAYQISAKVTDARGLTATSAVVTMIVSNALPQVSMITPTNGASFTIPASINLSAAATDPDGTVAKVEFFAGATKLGEAGSSPYSITWSNVGVGNYQLTALVTDDDGGTATNSSVSITVAEPDLSFTNTLIATGSVWKYFDDGSDPGATWMASSFTDTSWMTGPAQLGYGDNDEATLVRSNRADGTRIITTYFRRQFNVAEAAWYTNLTLRVLRDDGVRVFLNGAEIFRDNLPVGVVDFATLATATVSGAAESTLFVSTNVSPLLLREGLNLVASEIHQVNTTSSDISFDLELIGVGAPGQTIFLRSEPLAGSQFPLWFAAHPRRSYVIEASPDFQNWSPVSTNLPVNGRVEYRDADLSSSNRFFRAREIP